MLLCGLTEDLRRICRSQYEFICFDVPKVVRTPGRDYGHDEESLNGQDIKIHILEAYIWISEVFWVKSGFYRSTGRLPEPPGSHMGLHGT